MFVAPFLRWCLPALPHATAATLLVRVVFKSIAHRLPDRTRLSCRNVRMGQAVGKAALRTAWYNVCGSFPLQKGGNHEGTAHRASTAHPAITFIGRLALAGAHPRSARGSVLSCTRVQPVPRSDRGSRPRRDGRIHPEQRVVHAHRRAAGPVPAGRRGCGGSSVLRPSRLRCHRHGARPRERTSKRAPSWKAAAPSPSSWRRTSTSPKSRPSSAR